MGAPTLHKTWLLAVILAATASTASAAGDIKGSRDSPFLKRYEGSTIEHYEKKAFADFKFLLGPLPKRPEKEEVKTRTAEGPYTRLAYLIPEGRSSLEVLRNYEEELKAKGGRIVYECRHTACGPYMVGSYIYPDAKAVAGLYTPGSCLLTPSRLTDQHYSVVELPGDGALLSVLTYGIAAAHHPKCKFSVGRTVAVVDIIESKAREQKMVVVQASEMASAINATGKVALYGIHFDFNKADIKPESEATLVQMAKLLKDSPALRVLVVGHTDNVGGFSSNMDLSQRRAASVTAALAGQYGIAKERLVPVGVSYASPMATNGSEEGRAKNRRVELVENAPAR